MRGRQVAAVGEVVRKTENDFSIVGCFADESEPHRHCVIEPHCRLRGVFAAARDAFLAELDQHTVGDLASPADELAGVLGIVRLMPGMADLIEEVSRQTSFRKRGWPLTLLADFEPKGAVARQYGVYRAAEGTTERALFVIDGEGVIRWSYLSPVGLNPGADGILQALEALDEPRSASGDRSHSLIQESRA